MDNTKKHWPILQRNFISAIIALYPIQFLIYFYGKDGANNYLWVNNNFFFQELLVVAGIIAFSSFLYSIWFIKGGKYSEKKFKTFYPFILVLMFGLLFPLFIILLVFLDFVIYGF